MLPPITSNSDDDEDDDDDDDDGDDDDDDDDYDDADDDDDNDHYESIYDHDDHDHHDDRISNLSFILQSSPQHGQFVTYQIISGASLYTEMAMKAHEFLGSEFPLVENCVSDNGYQVAAQLA